MSDLLAYFSLRSVLMFASTAFALFFLMLILNIITVDEAAAILHLSAEGTSAFKLVVSRVQEVSANIINIISQLLNKLFGWAGVNIDLSKIHIDTSGAKDSMQSLSATSSTGSSGAASSVQP